MDTRDDRTLRRYLLGMATPDDRDEIERQLLADEQIADRLLALDDELMTDAARGRLAPAEQRAFEAAVRLSPSRAQRLAETRKLVDGIAELAADEDVLAAVPDRRRGVVLRLAFACSIVAVLLLLLGWQLWNRIEVGPAGTSDDRARKEASGGVAQEAPVLVTLTLQPRIERDSTAKQTPENALSLSPATTTVRLFANADLKTEGIERARATIRRHGGAAVPIAETPNVRLDRRAVHVDWTFAASQLDAGAYRLVAIGETGGGASETLFEWFFTVVRVPSAGPGPSDGTRER